MINLNVPYEEYNILNQISLNHPDAATRIRANIIMESIEANKRDFLNILKVRKLKRLVERYGEKGFCGILPCKELDNILRSR